MLHVYTQPDDTAISLATGGTSCDEQLSMVPELKETIKDLEQKTANLFMDNVTLSTKLKAIRKAETEQQDEIRNLEERLLQALKAQVNVTYLHNCIHMHHTLHGAVLSTCSHAHNRKLRLKSSPR